MNGKRVVLVVLVLLFMGGFPEVLSAAESMDYPVSPSQTEQKVKAIDPTMLIAPEALKQRQAKSPEKIILVDTRNAEGFNTLRIPDSINIPLHMVATKAFLKGRTIVLVNEGYLYRVMESACQRMRISGFDVFILSGGLNGWKKAGGVFEGTTFKPLNEMPPDVFVQEKEIESSLVIDASPVQKPEAKLWLPEAIHVSFLDEPEKAAGRIKTVVERHRNPQLVTVLIFNESGAQYGTMDRYLGQVGLKNVFYLAGGLDAYGRYLERQTMLRLPGETRLQTTDGSNASCTK